MRSWEAMMRRCYVESQPNYSNYGGSGIAVCDRWHKFVNFLEDMGERPQAMTLDRINPYGHYEPANCRWADAVTQRANTKAAWDAAV
jgi:hypothetical protein